MFKNKYVEAWDCHYSRIIESWHKACRHEKICCNTRVMFRDWLKQLNFRDYSLSEDQIHEIMIMYENGKIELEALAEIFIEEKRCHY